MEQDLNNVESWAKSKSKHKIPRMGKAEVQLPIWPEHDLEVLTMSQQQDLAVIKVNHIPGYVSKSTASRLRAGITFIWGL